MQTDLGRRQVGQNKHRHRLEFQEGFKTEPISYHPRGASHQLASFDVFDDDNVIGFPAGKGIYFTQIGY